MVSVEFEVYLTRVLSIVVNALDIRVVPLVMKTLVISVLPVIMSACKRKVVIVVIMAPGMVAVSYACPVIVTAFTASVKIVEVRASSDKIAPVVVNVVISS